MMARVGDWLMPEGDNGRVGLIIGMRNADGSPPYVIKWRRSGHVALVFPGPYDRIVPSSTETGPVLQAATALSATAPSPAPAQSPGERADAAWLRLAAGRIAASRHPKPGRRGQA
jgi:hypothetical protein